MPTLPNYILDVLGQNKTSLGKHPSFPPDKDDNFITNLVQHTFDELCDKIDDIDYPTLKNELSKLLSKCLKIERNNRQALEKLCADAINEMFNIPQDSIELDINLVDNIDNSSNKLLPEKTLDYSFEDIEDMNKLTDEIYKRRMLNALIEGASVYYMNYLVRYIKELFEINSDLPSMYKKILTYNNVLMFFEKDSIVNEKNSTDAGKVDVIIGSSDDFPIIKAEGILFPILFGEAIKGLLELAISHGLPKDLEKAKYVIAKSDFKLAELWDMRLGYSLWTLIDNQIKDCGYDVLDIGINYFLMSLSEMDCDQFNKSLQEIFAKTRKGKEILTDIIENILYEKESDEFDNFIKSKNDSTIQLTDDDDFTPEELLVDDEDDDCFTPEELITDEIEK